MLVVENLEHVPRMTVVEVLHMSSKQAQKIATSFTAQKEDKLASHNPSTSDSTGYKCSIG